MAWDMTVRGTAVRAYNAGGARGTITSVATDTLLNTMTGTMFAGEGRMNIEHFEPFGFTAGIVPQNGDGSAESVMNYITGARGHAIASVIGDRRYRPLGLKPGETAQHDDIGQMTLLRRTGAYLVTLDGPGNASSGTPGADNSNRIVSMRHVTKSKQPRTPMSGGQQASSSSTLSQPASQAADYAHEGTVNTEHMATKTTVETKDATATVGIYNAAVKNWTHQILSGSNPGPTGGDITSQLSGMASQAQALVTAAVGLPGVQGIGTQISTMGPAIVNAGGTTTIANAITTLGSSISTSTMSGMSALLTSLNAQISSLGNLLNPSGLLSQVLHTHILDKVNGIVHSAFQSMHSINFTNSGISLTSTQQVANNAPNINNNGNVNNSDNTHTTGSDFAAAFPVTSDVRAKTDIEDHPSVLNSIMSLKLKTFKVSKVNWRDGTLHPDAPRESLGFLAQDVQKVFPSIVHNGKFLAVEESKMGLLLMAAFQEFVVEVRKELEDLKKSKQA